MYPYPRKRLPPSQTIHSLHPISECLDSGKTLSKVFIDKAKRKDQIRDFLKRLSDAGVPVAFVPKIKLDKLTNNAAHQGIVAITSPISFSDLANVVQLTFEEGRMPFVVLLDSVTDVRNLGAIVRTALCAGVDAIVVDENIGSLNADCMKVSAGALAQVPICRVKNMDSAIKYLKNSGITIAACTEKAKADIFSADFKQPVALVMGAEDSGIDKCNLRLCDLDLKIPMHGTISSLNVSVAAAIAMYEVRRQRA